jgi:hypothetical protein
MPSTAIMIGSTLLPVQNFEIDGNAVTIAAGHWYLQHPDPTLSLLDEIVVQLTAAGVGSPDAFLRQDRRVQLEGSGAFPIDWGSATQLRDIFGMTQGNLSSATSHTADDVSPLLWAPGADGTPATIGAKAGYVQPHRSVRKSDDGSRYEVDWYGFETRQRLSWALVPIDRLQVEDTAFDGGTLMAFVEQVILRGYKFLHYENVTEGTGSTAMVFGDPFGPYVELSLQNSDVLRRLVANADDYGGGVEFSLLNTAEYD